MGAGISTPRGEWSSGLCSCEGDFGTCCITFFLPCVTFGRIAETVDEGQSSCFGRGCCYCLLATITCNWVCSCMYRGKLREKFGIQSNRCYDCCAHFFCEPCALCQEHAELKRRGYDPSKGWKDQPKVAPKIRNMFR